MRMSALLIVLLLTVATIASAGVGVSVGVASPAPAQPVTASESASALVSVSASASSSDPVSTLHSPTVSSSSSVSSLTTDVTKQSVNDATSSQAQIETSNTTTQPDSQTTITVSVRADQSAFWRIETQYALTSPNETRAFKEIARQYERGNLDIGPQITLFKRLQTEAAAATDRRMQIRNVSYHGSVEDTGETGTLALSFRWSNFAQQGQNETLLIGDVFKIPTDEADVQRTWMSIVGANQQIIIHPPNRYTVSRTSIPVQQRETAVVLKQPSDFEGDSGLEIRYSPIEEDSPPTALIAGAILGLLGIIGILYGSRRYRTDNNSDTDSDSGDPRGAIDDTPPSPSPGSGSDSPPAVTTDTEGTVDTHENSPPSSNHADISPSGNPDGSSSSAPTSNVDSNSNPNPNSNSNSDRDSNNAPSSTDATDSTEMESAVSDTASTSTPGASESGNDDIADADTTESSMTTESESESESEANTQQSEDSMPDISTDPALLSDEERVEQLLSRNGGRMRQASIVDKTGWSDAKVSQVLSMMAEENRVDKLRLGRENLISLPEESTTNTRTDDEQMSTD